MSENEQKVKTHHPVSVWIETIEVLDQLCDHHTRSRPKQLHVLVVAEAKRLGLLDRPPATG